MKRNAKIGIFAGAAALLVILAAGWRGYRATSSPRLPYRDHFASQQAHEWTPMGGSWRIQDDAVINWSDAPGSKLITGSPQWADYQLTTDMRLLAHFGDVGVIVRVNDAEEGTDAYHGYHVGLRSRDAAIIMGRADHNWLENRPVPLGQPIESGRWYRLHVVAVGCTVAAEALDTVTGLKGYAALVDDPKHCIHSGQLGLRSTDTSSAWRHVEIASANQRDLDAILQHVKEPMHPDYILREQDVWRMHRQYFPRLFPFPELSEITRARTQTASAEALRKLPLTNALALRTQPSSSPQTVRLHGVITSISPFYLQDETGGIELQPPDPGRLCIGDEIDVAGHPQTTGRALLFVAAEVAEPKARAPLTPLSITPAQAVSGAYEGSLVELTGLVLDHLRRADGSTTLVLSSEGQNFEARLRNDPFATEENWQTGSSVRVRGISTIDPNESSASSFAILVQSTQDVTLLAGPSWLAGWRLLCLVAAGILISVLAVYFVMHAARARTAAITAERERIAHEMHDTLAQSFAGVSYHLQGLRKLVRSGPASNTDLAGELDLAYEMVAGTHHEASAIIAALHPAARADGDLLVSIERAALRMLEKHGPVVRTHRRGEPRPLAPAVSDVFFRVALEAVANILRHSQAETVDLHMTFTPAQVTLSIEDDGVGFSAQPERAGFGLGTMRRRCATIHAQLAIDSEPGNGTKVSVTALHSGGRPRRLAALLATAARGTSGVQEQR